MHQPETYIAKFYKLTTGEDIIAYEISNLNTNEFIVLKQPMVIHIENDFPSARQLLNVREWIPPILTAKDEISLPKSYVIFSLEVNETFNEEFKEIVAYFYGVQPKKRKKVASGEGGGKVVSISSFVKDDSGKTH